MNRIAKKIILGAAGVVSAAALTATTAGIAQAATPTDPPAGSYQQTSADYKVSYKNWDFPTIDESCNAGYHVDGQWVQNLSQPPFFWATVTTQQTDGGHGDIYVDNATGYQQNGTNSDGPTYQNVSVELGNHSWSTDHTGNFTWTCDPN